MGGAVSSGRDNNELVDNLMGGGYIRTRSVERVFRALDRADYMTPTERDQAYKDLAWRSGALHLSAPCIYSEVVEALELKPGLSFLNLGSGTGYLSTLVGLLIGSGGTSHGVEIHPGVIEYSTKKLSHFQESSICLDEFDFCIPKYYCGNALCLAPLQTLYDRVYVGAGVLAKYENYFKQLIKVKGVLVMPLGDTLVQIQRVSETEWTSRQLLNVSFALLRAPTKEESVEPLKLDELVPASLMLLSRAAIRRAMLSGVCRRHPELREPVPRRTVSSRPRARRICIPLDPDTDNAGLNALHDLEGEEGGREMNALLSLVLNMGNNRAAGSLRLADEFPAPHPHNELEVLIDEMEQGSGSESDSGSSSDSSSSSDSEPARRVLPRSVPAPRPAPASPSSPSSPSQPRVRPSVAGATNPLPDCTASVSGSVVAYPDVFVCTYGRGGGGGGGVTAIVGEAAPGIIASGTDLTALNPAGRVEVDDTEVMMGSKPSLAASPCTTAHSDLSKPSTSGKTPSTMDPHVPPARPHSGGSSSDSSSGGSGSGPSSGTKRSGGSHGGGGAGGGGGGRVRRRMRLPACVTRRRTTGHNKSEVQIYFGKAGVYTISDVVQTEEMEAASGSEQREMDASSSDEDAPTSATGKKRQKLDSGIGEGTVSSSNSSTPRSLSPESSEHTDADADSDNHDDGSGRTHRRAPARSSSDSVVLTRCPQRGAQRNARRVRLSVMMKRAVKELPLPYALKKYVNLYRCFEV